MAGGTVTDEPNGGWERSDVGRKRRAEPDRRERGGRSAPGRGRPKRRVAGPLIIGVVLAAVVVGAGFAVKKSRTPPPPPPAPPALIPVTFPEGFRYTQMADTLAEKTSLSKDKYLELVGPSERGAKLAGRSSPTSLEGFLFPATYQIGTDTTEQYLVDRQVQAFNRTMASINLKAAKKRNLTRYDVVIIASMIEREVRVPAERPIVAGVMYNRLRLRMRLDIDATVQYALGDWRQITGADLELKSPYNTRKYSGLPPGPICNPGKASLQAAANPKFTDYLYYVARADGSGRHYFAKTLDEFNRIQAQNTQ
jgi:UPF0755 protein